VFYIPSQPLNRLLCNSLSVHSNLHTSTPHSPDRAISTSSQEPVTSRDSVPSDISQNNTPSDSGLHLASHIHASTYPLAAHITHQTLNTITSNLRSHHHHHHQFKMESGGASPYPSIPASRTSTPSRLNPDAPRQTKICVYCGAHPGRKSEHLEAARALAQAMAANNIGLGKNPLSSFPLDQCL